MECKLIKFSSHAINKMIERDIYENEIESTLKNGEIIMEYPNDKPYPSYLMFKNVNSKNIHIVVSKDEKGNCYIITCYIPDINVWQSDFKTRKK